MIVTRKIVLSTDARMDEGYVSVINITPKVQKLLTTSGVNNGTVTLFIPGTTAAIGTIEFEEGLIEDFKQMWQRIIPQNISYLHKFSWEQNNAFSHLRSSMMGTSLAVPFINRTLLLGQYQQIIFVEFDNRARNRQIVAQFMGE